MLKMATETCKEDVYKPEDKIFRKFERHTKTNKSNGNSDKPPSTRGETQVDIKTSDLFRKAGLNEKPTVKDAKIVDGKETKKADLVKLD